MPTTRSHIHFNNAGDSPSPPKVQKAIFEHLQLKMEVGGYRAEELVSERIKRLYTAVARLIGAKKKDGDYDPRVEIALVESATVGWTRVFYSILETNEKEYLTLASENGNEPTGTSTEFFIIVSEVEYAANLVAAVKFARDRAKTSRFLWRVLPLPSLALRDDSQLHSSGVVDLAALASMLEGTYDIGQQGETIYLDPSSIAIICITHIPTNSGVINPVDKIGEAIDHFNNRKEMMPTFNKFPPILYLVDACQSVGQISIDVNRMKCHALTATGRKYLRGPRGTGFLYVREDIANRLEPSHVDHSSAPVLQVLSCAVRDKPLWKIGLEDENGSGLMYSYKPGASRFEFWESNIAIKLGLGAAIEVCLSEGSDKIGKSCAFLADMLRKKLRKVPGVEIYHDVKNLDLHQDVRCGIVTFSVKGWDPVAIKAKMEDGNDINSSNSFHLSVVPATSTPLDSSVTGLGNKKILRASLSYFNTEAEIDEFCEAIGNLIVV